MFFQVCLMIFVAYSFVSQLLLLFHPHLNLGVTPLEENPYSAGEDHARLHHLLLANTNYSLSF